MTPIFPHLFHLSQQQGNEPHFRPFRHMKMGPMEDVMFLMVLSLSVRDSDPVSPFISFKKANKLKMIKFIYKGATDTWPYGRAAGRIYPKENGHHFYRNTHNGCAVHEEARPLWWTHAPQLS